MDAAADDLIHGYLDGRLTGPEVAALNARLARDPDLARRLALATLLHDRLRDHFRGGADDEAATPARPSRARPALATAAAALVVVAVVSAWASGDRRASAAEAVLGRLIEAQSRAGDRTYRVVALDADRPAADDPGPRGRPRPPIDGALLHVGGDGRYVLVRRPGLPGEFVTGSDGRDAWAVPPNGPVRVSGDPARFRGALPGEQQGLPFVDLRTALGRLRVAYELSVVDGPDGCLVARKRSTAHRGPRDVTIWFDPDTGDIRRLRMDGLPRARGGPRGVALDLIGRADLGPAFFGHAAHHAPGRPVVRE